MEVSPLSPTDSDSTCPHCQTHVLKETRGKGERESTSACPCLDTAPAPASSEPVPNHVQHGARSPLRGPAHESEVLPLVPQSGPGIALLLASPQSCCQSIAGRSREHNKPKAKEATAPPEPESSSRTSLGPAELVGWMRFLGGRYPRLSLVQFDPHPSKPRYLAVNQLSHDGGRGEVETITEGERERENLSISARSPPQLEAGEGNANSNTEKKNAVVKHTLIAQG